MKSLVLGTRGSALAVRQAQAVVGRLQAAHPGLSVEIRTIRTEGDRNADAVLTTIGGKGIFVREIEEDLLAGRLDLAVHSMKDMPTDQPPGLVFGAVPPRRDPRDVLITRAEWELAELPRGATVATGSPRRRCQLLHVRPDLRMMEVRGNVDTRVRKLGAQEFDALVLALAGLERLGLPVAARPIPVEACTPAVGQGALAVEVREDDAGTRRLLEAIDHPASARSVTCERAFLRRLGAGCLAPAAAYARLLGATLRIDAMVGDPGGARLLRESGTAPVSEAEALGERTAQRLLERGGEAILEEARSSTGPPA